MHPMIFVLSCLWIELTGMSSLCCVHEWGWNQKPVPAENHNCLQNSISKVFLLINSFHLTMPCISRMLPSHPRHSTEITTKNSKCCYSRQVVKLNTKWHRLHNNQCLCDFRHAWKQQEHQSLQHCSKNQECHVFGTESLWGVTLPTEIWISKQNW